MPGNLNTGMGGLKMTKAIKMLKGFAQFALVLFAIWFLHEWLHDGCFEKNDTTEVCIRYHAPEWSR
jgi:hypothetical protein